MKMWFGKLSLGVLHVGLDGLWKTWVKRNRKAGASVRAHIEWPRTFWLWRCLILQAPVLLNLASWYTFIKGCVWEVRAVTMPGGMVCKPSDSALQMPYAKQETMRLGISVLEHFSC